MAERAKMTPLERAKQFAPFAALNGHEEQLEQVRRPPTPKRELTEEEQAVLNRRLLSKRRGETVALLLFEDGGYRRLEGRFCALDAGRRLLILEGKALPLDQILWING